MVNKFTGSGGFGFCFRSRIVFFVCSSSADCLCNSVFRVYIFNGKGDGISIWTEREMRAQAGVSFFKEDLYWFAGFVPLLLLKFCVLTLLTSLSNPWLL